MHNSTIRSKSRSPFSKRTLEPKNLLLPSVPISNTRSVQTPTFSKHHYTLKASPSPINKSTPEPATFDSASSDANSPTCLKQRNASRKLTVPADSLHNYAEVITALSVMCPYNQGQISGIKFSQICLGMRSCASLDPLLLIFRDLVGPQPLSAIYLSQHQLSELCSDYKVEKTLSVLMKNRLMNENSIESLIDVIDRWWKKLNSKRKLDFISFNRLNKFLSKNEMVSNVSEIFKVLGSCKNVTHRQFFGVFSKALMKYLLSLLIGVVKDRSLKGMPADIAINTYKRKVIIKALKSHTNILDTLSNCKSYEVN